VKRQKSEIKALTKLVIANSKSEVFSHQFLNGERHLFKKQKCYLEKKSDHF